MLETPEELPDRIVPDKFRTPTPEVRMPPPPEVVAFVPAAELLVIVDWLIASEPVSATMIAPAPPTLVWFPVIVELLIETALEVRKYRPDAVAAVLFEIVVLAIVVVFPPPPDDAKKIAPPRLLFA